MNKLILALCFSALSASGFVNGQTDQNERALDPFTRIKAFDGLNVTLIPSEENKVVISGQHLDKVAVVQKGKLLKLRMQIDKIFSGKRTQVKVYFNGELSEVDANEESRIVWEQGAKQERLEIRAQEGGSIYLDAELTQLVCKAVTGGNLFVSGKTRFQDIRISTGGLMSAGDFVAEYTTVRVDAGGRAEIQSTDYVSAEVRAGGTIKIHGDPLKMDEKVFIGGTIERVE